MVSRYGSEGMQQVFASMDPDVIKPLLDSVKL